MALFPGIASREFDLRATYHADAILQQHFPEASEELDRILGEIAIPIVEIVQGGGGEARSTQRLRRRLEESGWRKFVFEVEKRINGRTTLAQSHAVDHVKSYERGTLALEIEWNNKDPFFDRDLENFNRLHADGAISAGIIVTRGRSLQDGILGRIRSFAEGEKIGSFEDLVRFDVTPTQRQRDSVREHMERRGSPFAEAWSAAFTNDKFGRATTHWDQLQTRLARGVGSPCPIVGVGIPLGCITM